MWKVPGRLRWVWETLAPFRSHVAVEGVEELVGDRLAKREQNFLWAAEQLIFANPPSPYRPLLELAGYDLAKLRELVFTRGLDAALDQLRDDGVYVRVEEFRGMAPAIRHGHALQFQSKDFANPVARGVLQTLSSGSRSTGTQTDISMANLLDKVRLRRWILERSGLLTRDIVLWSTYLAGLLSTAQYTIMKHPPRRWFTLSGRGDWATSLLIMAARISTGLAVPRPEETPAERVLDIARYICRLNSPRGVLVMAYVNPALRLIMAAEEAGIRLGDVAFLLGGEPLTPLKRRQFEERGFKVYSSFGFTELGPAAWSCPAGRESDDLHVLTDSVAVRQNLRTVDRGGTSVPAYLFTSLLPHMRHVMVNLESGDYGGLEERRCDCFLDHLGFHLHMHTIHSFEKLTAEGMTFVGPDLITLLEEVLPREFGGDARHYQLVEGEDARGFTRLYLLVSPRLGEVDHKAVRRTVLRGIGETHVSPGEGRLIEQIWEGGNTIQVLRREPLATTTGKILHLHRDRGALWATNSHRKDGDRLPQST